jgi:hypothetical protein
LSSWWLDGTEKYVKITLFLGGVLTPGPGAGSLTWAARLLLIAAAVAVGQGRKYAFPGERDLSRGPACGTADGRRVGGSLAWT